MKKTFFAIILLTRINGFAQDSTFNNAVKQIFGSTPDEIRKQNNSTSRVNNTTQGSITLEEFNYLSKGLKDDLNNGKDLKSGYRFEQPAAPETTIAGLFEGTTYKLVKCYRSNENKPFALVVKTLGNNKVKQTFCIPPRNAPSSITKSCELQFTSHFTNSAATQFLYSTLQALLEAY